MHQLETGITSGSERWTLPSHSAGGWSRPSRLSPAMAWPSRNSCTVRRLQFPRSRKRHPSPRGLDPCSPCQTHLGLARLTLHPAERNQHAHDPTSDRCRPCPRGKAFISIAPAAAATPTDPATLQVHEDVALTCEAPAAVMTRSDGRRLC